MQRGRSMKRDSACTARVMVDDGDVTYLNHRQHSQASEGKPQNGSQKTSNLIGGKPRRACTSGRLVLCGRPTHTPTWNLFSSLGVNALPCISAPRVTQVTIRGGLRAVFVRYPHAASSAAFTSTDLANFCRWQRFHVMPSSPTDSRATREGNFGSLASGLHCVCMKVPRCTL